MYLTPRQKQILYILLNKEEVLSVTSLAQQLNVSKRTVQREMESLGDEISALGIRLESKSGKGVWLEGTQEARYSLLEDLVTELGHPVLDKDQRSLEIIGKLLKTDAPLKLYYFANLFRVSESTIAKDMDQAARWLLDYNLSLIRKQGVGVYVEGEEADRRRAIRACIKQTTHDSSLQLLPQRGTSMENLSEENNKFSICGLLDQDIVKKVILCLGSIHHPIIDQMTDYSYTGLIIHIAIAISRILQKEAIKEVPAIWERLKEENSYPLARRIVESLEKEFSLSIPEVECAYICMHLKGAKRQTVEKPDLKEKEDGFFVDYGKTLKLIYRMIDCYDKSLAFSLKRDEEFIEALMSHMRPTLVRLQYGMDITNPLLLQLQSSYPDIFEKCRNAAAFLEKELGCQVPEAEIGYLVMHFATAVMRISQKNRVLRKVSIGVVCASGIGISRLISTRMKQIFKEKVETKTYGYDQLLEHVPDSLDFVVTTFEIPELSIDHILVNPLLLEENLAEIQNKVEFYSSLPKKQDKKGAEQFLSQLDTISRVSLNIKHIIEHFSLYRVQNGIEFGDLVGKAGRLTGQTEAEQIQIYQDIIEREKLATQVMEDFDLALLHAKTSGVTAPIFQVYLPEQGAFTNPYWKGIHCVIVILIPDDSFYLTNGSIVGALSSKLAENDTFIHLLLTGDIQEIKGFLERTLKKFFIQFINRI